MHLPDLFGGRARCGREPHGSSLPREMLEAVFLPSPPALPIRRAASPVNDMDALQVRQEKHSREPQAAGDSRPRVKRNSKSWPPGITPTNVDAPFEPQDTCRSESRNGVHFSGMEQRPPRERDDLMP